MSLRASLYVFLLLFLVFPIEGMPCGIRPGARRIKRIVNGQNAHPHSWPWMAQLLLDSDHRCGATLVQKQFVLTAAHCIGSIRDLSHYTIRLGEHNRWLSEGTEQDFRITKEFIHPQYNRTTNDFDLALLKLNKPARLNAQVGTACLPPQNLNVNQSSPCCLTGWGKMSNGGRISTVLKEAWMPIVPNEECAPVSRYYKVTDNMMCSGLGPNSTVSGCYNDSGGPFVCQDTKTKLWFLQGTLTGGTGDCGAAYSIYARVDIASSWIESVILNETNSIHPNNFSNVFLKFLIFLLILQSFTTLPKI